MLFEKTVEKIYKNNIFVRCDDTGYVFYYTAKDFPGLNAEPFIFHSRYGHDLVGNFYFYDNYRPGRIIVFDHGHGGGHTAYMKEIEILCKNGYLVYAYDHTGCMASGGESTNGLGQSLVDLDDCITALKAADRCKDLSFSVMGHSWGGFSAMNIAALHRDITHAVVISGFVSVEKMIEQNFSGILKLFRKSIMLLERRTNYEVADINGVETLSNTNAKVLLIYSDDDETLHKDVHYDTLYSSLKDKENIFFLLEHGKNHNPNYTEDAVKYKDEFVKHLSDKNDKLKTIEEKDTFIASFDWERMTMQDDGVWEEILRHFER